MKTYLKSFALCLLFLIPIQTEAVVQEDQCIPEPQIERWERVLGERFKKKRLVKKIKCLKKWAATKRAPGEKVHTFNVLAVACGVGASVALYCNFFIIMILPFYGFIVAAFILSIAAVVFGVLGLKKPGRGLGIAGMILGGLILLSFLIGAIS